jgi:hypothetical protein
MQASVFFIEVIFFVFLLKHFLLVLGSNQFETKRQQAFSADIFGSWCKPSRATRLGHFSTIGLL